MGIEPWHRVSCQALGLYPLRILLVGKKPIQGVHKGTKITECWWWAPFFAPHLLILNAHANKPDAIMSGAALHTQGPEFDPHVLGGSQPCHIPAPSVELTPRKG